MSKNVLLIQPHSDDVLFSASKYLFNRGDYGKITLFTVEGGDEKRVAEDEVLCEVFELDEYINSDIVFEDKSYYTYYKELKFKKFNQEQSYECLEHAYGEDFLNKLKKDIVSKVKKYKKKGYEIVVCLGVGHPMHLFVRDCCEKHADVFYRDFPHSYKRKAVNEVEKLADGLVMSDTYFDEQDHEAKFDAAYQIYKTQRSLLFFEQGYIKKKIAEEYYTKS